MIRRYAVLISLLLTALALGAVTAADVSPAVKTIESSYPGLSSGPLSAATLGVVKGALLEAGDVKITSKDLLDRRLKMDSSAYKTQLATYQFALLEDIAIEKLIEKEARDWAAKNGQSDLKGEELMRGYVTSLVGEVKVSDEEARKFYEENMSMMGSASYQQVESAVKSYLQNEKTQALLNKHVATLSARHRVRISDIWAKQQYNKWIKTPVEVARRSGKPTMAKFGADTCKPCLAMAPIIKEVEKAYALVLNVVDINVEKEPVIGSHYGEGSIPLVIYYDKEGKEVSRTVGYRDKAAIQVELAKLGVK